MLRVVPGIKAGPAELVEEDHRRLPPTGRRLDSQINQLRILVLRQVTQQNAPLQKKVSATSEELTSQAEQLQATIAYFKIDDASSSPTRSTPSVSKLKAKVATMKGRHWLPLREGSRKLHARRAARASRSTWTLAKDAGGRTIQTSLTTTCRREPYAGSILFRIEPAATVWRERTSVLTFQSPKTDSPLPANSAASGAALAFAAAFFAGAFFAGGFLAGDVLVAVLAAGAVFAAALGGAAGFFALAAGFLGPWRRSSSPAPCPCAPAGPSRSASSSSASARVIDFRRRRLGDGGVDLAPIDVSAETAGDAA